MEKKHREKIRNTVKTQGKHREFYLGWNVATLLNFVSMSYTIQCNPSSSASGGTAWYFPHDIFLC